MKTLIIDQGAIVSEGLHKILLEEFKQMTVSKISEIPSVKSSEDYDLIIINMCSNQRDSIEKIGNLRDKQPNARLLAVVESYEMSMVATLNAFKVNAIIELCSERTVIVNAIQAVADGKVIERVISRKSNNLTRREIEILYQIAEGYKNSEIAEILFISEKTVKNHISQIFRKIGIKNRAQAVKYVYDNNLKSI
jgi:DNA-binding NarL/FixJ family response regulator